MRLRPDLRSPARTKVTLDVGSDTTVEASSAWVQGLPNFSCPPFRCRLRFRRFATRTRRPGSTSGGLARFVGKLFPEQGVAPVTLFSGCTIRIPACSASTAATAGSRMKPASEASGGSRTSRLPRPRGTSEKPRSSPTVRRSSAVERAPGARREAIAISLPPLSRPRMTSRRSPF